MSILSILTEKPWLTPGLDPAEENPSGVRAQPPAALGLFVYMSVLTLVFFMLIVVYVLRMGNYATDAAPGAADALPTWSIWSLCGIAPAHDWKPMPEPWLLWVNTAVLGLSSIAWQGARRAAVREKADAMRTWLFIGGGLGLLFVAGQLAVWRVLVEAGFYVSGNPAYAFFYVITTLHGLHMLGGIVVWGRTVGRLLGGADAGKVQLGVELNAVYWHFLLIVWIVMFALLVLT